MKVFFIVLSKYLVRDCREISRIVSYLLLMTMFTRIKIYETFLVPKPNKTTLILNF